LIFFAEIFRAVRFIVILQYYNW